MAFGLKHSIIQAHTVDNFLTDTESDAGKSQRRENKALISGQRLHVVFPRRRWRHHLSSIGKTPLGIDHEEYDEKDGDQAHERGHPKAPTPIAETCCDT